MNNVIILMLLTLASTLTSNVYAAGGTDNKAFVLAESFTLKDSCPPSFELTGQGECRLLTQYQFYSSVQNKGLGGTQTNLPPHRDGFTPAQIDLGRFLFFDPA